MSTVFSESEEEGIYRSGKSLTLKAAKGPGLTFLSSVCCALSAEFTALGSKSGIPGLQLVFFFRVAQFLLALLAVVVFRPKLTCETKQLTGILVLGVIVNNLATNLVYMSFVYAAPSIAFGIIQGSMPVLTACFGFCCLKESISLVGSCGMLISIIGTVLTGVGMGLEGSNSTQSLVVSIVLPAAAALTRAPDGVLTRALVGPYGLSGITVLFYSTSVGTVLQIIVAYMFNTPVWTMSGEAAGFVIGLCLTKTFEKAILYIAVLKMEKVGNVVGMQMIIIPLTILLDYLFLGKTPNLYQAVGLTLVLLGSGVVAGYTWWTHRKEEQHNALIQRLGLEDKRSDSENVSDAAK